MKLIWTFFLVTTLLPALSAQANEELKLSVIKSIDDSELAPALSQASEEAFPYEQYSSLLDLLEADDFTVLTDSQVINLFSKLENNPRARMSIAGGKCSYRRSYIQSYLKKLGILSGKLYIQCPSLKGHMRLIDQVTGRRYTFSNFHDTNIVAVTEGYRVMDVQFKSGPVSLSQYLAEVEASQKLKPLKDRSSQEKGFCYWSVK